MKAVILVGGEGTRLRPLTLTLPKPVVPVVDRPFLRHQLDLLDRIGVSDVVFSVAYRPEKVEAVFGDGSAVGKRIHYAVENTPLGTGGAVKNAEARLDGTTVVFNGDVLTDVDLPAVVERHRSSGAAATIVLYPVANPSAYGLVETDATSRVRRFVEKPQPSQITTDTINAGIYVLEKATLALMPAGVPHSIERAFFPALLERGDHVQAFVHRGYWIDIGTPAKYLEVHRDILHGRFPVALMAEPTSGGWIHSDAHVHPEAELRPPFFVGPGCRVEAASVLGPDAVLTESVTVREKAEIGDSVLWQGVTIGRGARVQGALLSTGVRVGDNAVVGPGSVLGEGTQVTDYSRTC